jgi:hypothetical protein
MMDGIGLVAVMNNKQLDDFNAKRAQPQVQQDNEPAIEGLAAYVRKAWESAKQAKSRIETEMVEALRQREGEYSPDKLHAIREHGGSEIYMMLTNAKCRAAEAWIRDVIFQPGERPFSAGPTPVPTPPPGIADGIAKMVMQEAEQAIMQGLYVSPQEVYERGRQVAEEVRRRVEEDAKHAAKLMEDEIDDAFVQGEFYDALDGMIPDLVALHAGFIKGPVIRRKAKLVWEQNEVGRTVARASDEITSIYYSPSPFDVYPSADSRGPNDGYILERIPTRRGALHGMIGVPGYKEDAIRKALIEYQHGFTLDTPIEQTRRELEKSHNWQLSPDKTLDVLEFWGSVPGSLLIQWGMDDARVTDPQAEYEACVWLVGRHCVRAVLNEHPLKHRPYSMASYDRINGAFWGRGLPRLIRDLQDMCNSAARSLNNNMAFSSGPIGEVEMDRLAAGEDPTNIYPMRMLQTKSSATTPAPAVRWHNIPSNAQELMAVYQFFSQIADIYSGVQSFEHGNNPRTGAAGTASGLSMLLNASSRLVKRVIAGVDKAITACVDRQHALIMLYSEKEYLKRDVEIEARGASSLLVKEQQQVRLIEMLGMTNNPVDLQIMGMEGRTEMLREAVKSLAIDTAKAIPPDDVIRARAMAAVAQSAQMQQPQQPRQLDSAGNPAGGQDSRAF